MVCLFIQNREEIEGKLHDEGSSRTPREDLEEISKGHRPSSPKEVEILSVELEERIRTLEVSCAEILAKLSTMENVAKYVLVFLAAGLGFDIMPMMG